MNQIPIAKKEKIVQALEKAGANKSCPRCQNQGFTLLDGYFSQPIQFDLSGVVVLGGPAVPSIVVVCTRCGYMSQHALGVLLPNEVNKMEGSK